MPKITMVKNNAPTKVSQKDILTYDEIDEMYQRINDLEHLVMIRIGLNAGLRIAEVLDLEVCDIYAEKGALLIRKGKDTTGKKDDSGARIGKERFAPVDSVTIALIQCLTASRAPTVRPADHRTEKIIQIKRRTAQRHTSEIMPRPGLSFHSLRHTCATMQLNLGMNIIDVRDNMGHTDVKITQQYLHLNINERSRKYRDALRTI